jgi:hypothetical protein
MLEMKSVCYNVIKIILERNSYFILKCIMFAFVNDMAYFY